MPYRSVTVNLNETEALQLENLVLLLKKREGEVVKHLIATAYKNRVTLKR